MRNCSQQPFGPLMLNKMPNKPWKNISIDLIAILSVLLLTSSLKEHTSFPLIFNSHLEIWCNYQMMDFILYMNCYYKLSQIKQHLAEIFWKKYKLLRIELTMSTAYHLQTDGQIEYVYQILEQYPRCYVDYNLKTG